MKKFKEMLFKYKQLSCIIIAMILALIMFVCYNYVLNSQLNPMLLPVANTYLESGHRITKDDITYIEVPKSIVIDNIYVDEEEMINKYVNSYNAIAKGSLFYKELVTTTDDIKDANSFNLNENEVAVSIDADVKSSYANSILKGHNVDIYFKDEIDDKLVYGLLVKNARVIAVYDSNGQNIDQTNTNDTSVIVLALSYEDADLVSKAKFIGEVFPIVSYDTLNQKEDHSYYDIAKMKQIISSGSLDLDLMENTNE